MKRAEEKLLNPPPGGRIEAARDYGIDLTLLVERLRKTPEERVRDLQLAAASLEQLRGKASVPKTFKCCRSWKPCARPAKNNCRESLEA
jgi:hypothetical protein